MTESLYVVLKNDIIGTLAAHGDYSLTFTYDTGYAGMPLSCAMTKTGGTSYPDKIVRPWFDGLLPDNKQTRLKMAREAGCQPMNTGGLLKHFGKDLPGAVRVCRESELEDVLNQESGYIPIGEAEIGERLADTLDESGAQVARDEHWSLGGAQGKIALARIENQWYRCTGSAASTHILKPGVKGYWLQGLDEYLCMQLAEEIGMNVSKTNYQVFGKTPAIVVERYDRIKPAKGKVLRLHQEDFCQALSVKPEDKYDPTPAAIIDLLKRESDDNSVMNFVQYLFYNYLIGATDAHAKNFSLIHLEAGRTILAPLYDVASILPYQPLSAAPRHAAMRIGREKTFGRLTGSNVKRFARTNQLDEQSCLETMKELACRIKDALPDLNERHAGIPGVEVLGPELERTVRANCDAMLCNLDRDGRSVNVGQFKTIASGSVDREGPPKRHVMSPREIAQATKGLVERDVKDGVQQGIRDRRIH